MKWLWAWLVSWFTLVTPVPSPLPSPSPLAAFLQYGQYRYASVAITQPDLLSLDSNLDRRASAADLAREKDCRFLTNAGFYDTNNRHLGWFYTQEKEVSPAIKNRLLDGFLYLQNGEIDINFNQPENAVWGLQSGPVLIDNGTALKLSIRDDQPRRRVVAALDADKNLTFLVVVVAQSDYGGPLLADLPELVKSLYPAAITAINLDGGSASAFYSPEVELKEYSPIGGYFCYTEL